MKLERFAPPEVTRAELVQLYRDGNPDDLLDALNEVRQRQAARALRDALED
jgi:hypothetical protein